jgi:hypothetical protein
MSAVLCVCIPLTCISQAHEVARATAMTAEVEGIRLLTVTTSTRGERSHLWDVRRGAGGGLARSPERRGGRCRVRRRPQGQVRVPQSHPRGQAPGQQRQLRPDPCTSRAGRGRGRHPAPAARRRDVPLRRHRLLPLAEADLPRRGTAGRKEHLRRQAGTSPQLGRPAIHIPCGLDIERFAPRERGAARRAFGVPDGSLALLFPSRRERPKKMYSRFEAVREELKARGHPVHELRLENTPGERVPELLAAADVMARPPSRKGLRWRSWKGCRQGFRWWQRRWARWRP